MFIPPNPTSINQKWRNLSKKNSKQLNGSTIWLKLIINSKEGGKTFVSKTKLIQRRKVPTVD